MHNNKRVKGFTLMELIVVMAIIGILAAILAPTMGSYYRRSRLKEVNSDASLVYNAAQTEMQKYIAADRTETTKSMFNGTVLLSYEADGTISYGTVVEDALTEVVSGSTDPDIEAACRRVVNSINRTVSDGDQTNWTIYVEHYIVKACVSATTVGSNYIGMCSAEKADGTRGIAEEPADVSYANFIATGEDLRDFAGEYYDQIAATTEATT